MNYSELLQLAKGWGNFISDRIIIWRLPYNNGLAEGSVNKIKVIKRIMYGRNSFNLLKSKVLFHEVFHSEFN